MSVGNICAGFKKTGVYPFNPEAILKDFAVVPVCESETEPADRSETEVEQMHVSEIEPVLMSETEPVHWSGMEEVNCSASSTQNRFSNDQIAKFEKRYENNYDIYTDHDYVAWLQENSILKVCHQKKLCWD